MRFRYSDFLFEYNKKVSLDKYQISQYLLSSLTEIVNHYYINNEDIHYIPALARLVEVSLLMSNKEKIEESINSLCLILSKSNESKKYEWIPTLSKIFREIINSKFKEAVSEKQLDTTIDILEESRKGLYKNKNYNLYQRVCKELIEYQKYDLIFSEQVDELRLEIGKGYELESDYQNGRQEKSLLVKASFLEKAMSHYANIGEIKKVEEMKISIKQAYKQSMKNEEMKLLSVPLEIPIEIMEERIASLVCKDIQSSLDKIAYTSLIPDIDEIAEHVNSLSKEFPLLNLISQSIINDGKKIEHSVEEGDLYKINFNNYYMLHIEVDVGLLLEKVFDKLIEEQNFNTKDVMKKFDEWKHLDEKNYPFIEAGIKRFFEKDYVSAMHILVPQLESTLRNFFVKAGYSTTSIKKSTGQNEETFHEFLNREDIEKALGRNVKKMIQVIMVEKSGLNLRNDIAHGLIDFSDITKNRCILVIYLYLVLTRYSITDH